jgi:hypothetical protein
MTEITRETLQRRYADLIDDELLRRLHSGVLTELAQDVATAEAQARGLSLEKPESAPGAPVPDVIDFAPDEFERNPYQAPRVAAQTATEGEQRTTRTSIWDVLWYLYVAVLALLVATAAAFDANALDLPAVVETITTAFALAGIVAWRRRRAWLHPVLWITSLAVNLAWLAVRYRQSWAVLDAAGESDLVPMFVIGMAISTALYLPLFWGLARYALFSPSIWRGRVSRAANEAA